MFWKLFAVLGFSWSKISEMLCVSRCTVARRVRKFGLEHLERYSDISDGEIEDMIKEYISRHGSGTGEPLFLGCLNRRVSSFKDGE